MPLPESERASRDDWVFDTVLAILAVTFVLAPYLVTIAFYGPVSSEAPLLAATVTGLGLSASFILRRHYPLPFMAVVAFLCLIHVVLVPLPFTLLVAVPAAIYAVARHVPQNTAWILFFWIPAAVAATLRWFLHYDRTHESTVVSLVGGFAFVGIIVTAYTIGRRGHDLAVAAERARIDELEEARAQRRELAGDQQASYAAAANMAADLYDAFADTISHMIVQADQANVLVASDHRDEAVAKMSLVAATGRDVLADLRAASTGVGTKAASPGGSDAVARTADGTADQDGYVADYDDGELVDGQNDYPEAEDFDEAGYSWDEAADYADYDDAGGEVGPEYPEGEYLDESPDAELADAVPARALVDHARGAEVDYDADWNQSGGRVAHLPSTGAEGVPQLTADAGAEFVETGQPVAVDGMVGVTLFRIVEEALDNARRHAGPQANPQVHLDWGDDDVEVSVTNQATGYRARPSTRPGEGLNTMAERATAINGVLEAGPTEDGGYMVWAKLPYDWQAAAEAAGWGDDGGLADQDDAGADWDQGQRAYRPQDEPEVGAAASGAYAEGAATTGEWTAGSGWDDQAVDWAGDGAGALDGTAPWAEDWAEAAPGGARRPLVADWPASPVRPGADWAQDYESGLAGPAGVVEPLADNDWSGEDWSDEDPGVGEPYARRQAQDDWAGDGDESAEPYAPESFEDEWDEEGSGVAEPYTQGSSEDAWGAADDNTTVSGATDDWADDDADAGWEAVDEDEWVQSDYDWEAASWDSPAPVPAPRGSSAAPAHQAPASRAPTPAAPAATAPRSAAGRQESPGHRQAAAARPVAGGSRSAPAPRSSSRPDPGAPVAGASRQTAAPLVSSPPPRQAGSRASVASAGTGQRSGAPSRDDPPRRRPRPRI